MFICLVRDSLSPPRPGVLEQVARACSPRVERHGDDAVICDGRGLRRVIGMPAVIAEEMRRMAWEREVGVRVAIAGSRAAAWLLAHVRPGTTVVAPGDDRRCLGRLPLAALRMLPVELVDGRGTAAQRRAVTARTMADTLATLERWGVTTLGDFARLPRAEVLTRLGTLGGRLHMAACGEDERPLVPEDAAPRFVERMELEWPVEGLEPLSFVLARVCEALAASLERADRGAVTVSTRLRLVTRASHERTLTLPTPMRDPRTLRTLILLDLEAHPAPAGIDVVEVECGVTPGRIVQGSLLTYPVPTPEAVSTLVARLQALVGESSVGSPVVVDSHDPRAVAMTPFTVRPWPQASDTQVVPRTAFRRQRTPSPIRVRVERGRPVEVGLTTHDLAVVTTAAGPWRTSGQWWTNDAGTWDRDEWDVAVESGAVYRLARDRRTDRWELDGELD